MALILIAYFILSKFSPKLFSVGFASFIGYNAYGATPEVLATVIILILVVFNFKNVLKTLFVVYWCLIPIAYFQLFC